MVRLALKLIVIGIQLGDMRWDNCEMHWESLECTGPLRVFSGIQFASWAQKQKSARVMTGQSAPSSFFFDILNFLLKSNSFFIFFH